MPSSLTPPPNEPQELENICNQIEHIPINIRKSKDNLTNLTKGLEFLLEKINTNKIITQCNKFLFLFCSWVQSLFS